MGTQNEVEERVENAKVLINGRLHHSQIRKALMKTYDVSRAQADRYIRRAKEIIQIEAGQDPQHHRVDAYAFYRGVLTDKHASIRDKLKAQERLDKLLGLEMPVKIARTDSDGHDIPIARIEAEISAVLSELSLAERATQDAAADRGIEGPAADASGA
jgi:hypothetical protein